MTATDNTPRFAPLSLHNVALPDHLIIRVVSNCDLLKDFNRFGYDGEQFFGTAFIQGKRLQFSTAMPVITMLRISKIDRAPRAARVDEVMDHANRPRVPAHAKALRQYFLDTACAGEKFILPAFAFNFGDEHTTREDAPDAVLYIYANENDGSTNGWPALLQLPHGIPLDTTDGAHRGGEMNTILSDANLSEDQRDNLRRNACDVKIIFERKRVDAHQDFADCARAKPITGSLISTFDVRDLRNARAVQLVKNVAFLQHYVDATASNINLSARSLKIWSMSAVRGFVGHVQDFYPPALGSSEPVVEATLAEKMSGAEHFFAALIKYVPSLHTLNLSRTDPVKHTDTPATFRNKRGGDIALRGVGMSLFARAFVYAKENGKEYEDVARRLGQVDWHLLDCEREELPSTATEEGRIAFPGAVRQHLNPLFSAMMVIGENRYRIGSSNEEANAAWSRIRDKHFNDESLLAAE